MIMQINKRILKTLLFIIGVIWLGNIMFYYSKKIDGPIFTYTYNEGRGLGELSYLMDQDDKDKVETIIFPELNNFELIVPEDESYNFFLGLNNNNNINDRNSDGSVRYNIYNINLWASRNREGIQLASTKQDFNITKIKYRTVNGKEGECEIGKMIHKEEVTSENYLDKPYHLFSPYCASSSSDEGNKSTYKALDDIKLVELKGEFKDELLKYCNIKVNGENLTDKSFPIEISRGADFDISINWDKEVPFYEEYDGEFIFIARDPEGTEENIEIKVPILSSKITFKDVENLLEKRGLK